MEIVQINWAKMKRPRSVLRGPSRWAWSAGGS